MCWNAEVSLQSFLIGLSAIGIGIQRGVSLPVLLFSLTIVLMQLIEYVVWSYPTLNREASIVAAWLLWFQPIASILTLSSPQPLLLSYLGISALLAPMATAKEYSMTRAPNGHLAWNWLTKEPSTYLSLAVYFVFLLLPLVMSRSFLLLGLSLGTLAVSLYTFWKDNTWGSMWCWMINWVAVASLLKESPGSVQA